ncbi:Glutamate receptor ionotropic, kainate 2 [Nymphon striatum]|nr:Glutamate receptor ionotropic, kainate 2 [Nymphon striatum]
MGMKFCTRSPTFVCMLGEYFRAFNAANSSAGSNALCFIVIFAGGAFETIDEELIKSFGYAVDGVNANHSLLPRTRLSAQIKRLEPQNSFNASKEVCNLLRSGVAAIFGPQSSYISPLMDSLLSKFDIPHIETRWDFSRRVNDYSINVFPHWEALSKTYRDLVVAMGWKSFTILYEEDEALIRLQYLLQITSSEESTVALRKLNPEYRLVLKELKKHSVTRIVLDCKTENIKTILEQAKQVGIMTDYHSYIITNLDLHTVDLSETYFSQTNITGFRLVDPDNLLVKKIRSDLSYRENINKKKDEERKTIIKTETALIFDAVAMFSHALKDLDRSQGIEVRPIDCETGSPWSYGKSLISFMKSGTIQGLTGAVSFDESGFRSDIVVDVIDLVKTGLVRIGEWSLRTGVNFTRDEEAQMDKYKDNLMNKTLRIVTVLSLRFNNFCNMSKKNETFSLCQRQSPSQIKEISSDRWHHQPPPNCFVCHSHFCDNHFVPDETDLVVVGGAIYLKEFLLFDLLIDVDRRKCLSFSRIAKVIESKTLTLFIVKPYTMLKLNADPNGGNERFEGYCIDLIEAISQRLKFKYEIHIAKDKTNGKMDPETREWNGMIGELINGEADLAIGDLTITYEREQAVDFTMPFMNLGISILFKKPEKPDRSLFSFLSPLSWDVWLYMLTAYLGVSIFMFIVARFSPYEWQSPHPCDQDVDVLENQFTLMNSLWFTIGSLMQQGSDLAPRAWSTRMVAGTWWFFTLIMISSYTANLAAFLTVQRMVSPIESAEDLARQTKIEYGCYKGGSTEAFFRNSKMGTYQRMWSFMESARPSVLVKSGKEGTERVMKGNYAYLMESTSIEYVTQRNCKVTQIGGWLDSKGYGIATPPGSPYRRFISSVILKLQEETLLDVLKITWWKKRNIPEKKCDVSDKKKGSTGTANELSLANVGGVFVVLLFGVGLACIIAVLEFIWKTRRIAEDEREHLCTEMIRELRFAIGCHSSRRPIPKKPQEYTQTEENFVTFPGFSSLSSKEPLA